MRRPSALSPRIPLDRIGLRGPLCSLAIRKPSDARKYLEEVTKLAPDDATGWLNFGRVCQDLGNQLGADQAYQKANELSPDRPDILYHMADGYSEKYARAGVEAAKRAARATVECLENFDGAARMQALQFPPELPLVLIRNLGRDPEFTETCAEFLRELADRAPTLHTDWLRPAALNHLGLLLANTAKYEPAVDAYRNALKADATIDPAHFNLAMVLARSKKWEEAERELKIYAERHKGSPVVAYGWATIEEMKGDADEAIRHFRGTLERAEKNPVSAAVRGRLDVPRDWLEEARRFVSKLTGEGAGPEGEQWVPGKD